MNKISIILPTYNSDNVLEKAIKSVEKQTYENWELIIIENGKKGQAEQIVQSFKDKRIIYIYQEQPNVSNARNVGLETATGEYIAFIDSDDQYEIDFLEKMLSNLTKNETQLVTCGYRRVFEKNKMLIENNEKILNTTNIKEYLETTKENYLYNELWNKMYISEIIKEHNIKFDKSYELGEDFLFNLDYTKYIKKASFINEPLYIYTDGEYGLKLRYRPNKFEIEYDLTKYLEKFYIEKRWNMDYIYNRYARVYYNQIIDIYKENNPATDQEKDEQLKKIVTNPKYKENLIYETENGEMVRSKSEVIIANMLRHHKKYLLYKYERPLEVVIDGKVTIIYPDFTILNCITGKIVYWEHAGRMDDVRYTTGFVQKMNIYAKNNIVTGHNLIVTYETMNYPLDIKVVKNLIEMLINDIEI